MTVDHRIYLRPGVDLVTAEDAAAFVRTYVVDPDTEWDLSDVHNYLERRLDRERRQACRRAVARHFAEAREHREGERDWASSESWARVARECRTESLKRALAFRAAARAK